MSTAINLLEVQGPHVLEINLRHECIEIESEIEVSCTNLASTRFTSIFNRLNGKKFAANGSQILSYRKGSEQAIREVFLKSNQ